jgi:hypothetical protein
MADWISAWAKADGHIPVSLKVGAESSDTIWHVLHEAIDEALDQLGINLERTGVQRVWHSLRKGSLGLKDLAAISPTVSEYGITLGGAIFPIVLYILPSPD